MNSTRLTTMLSAIDKVNLQDPNKVSDPKSANSTVAKEWLYGQQMSECLTQYWPDSNEFLQIAVRAQHIKRWQIARNEYPEGKAGYLTWRRELGKFHAQFTAQLMQEHGYSEADANETSAIIRKEKLRSNSASQTLEDVACLVFLQHYFADFAGKHDEDKIISILQKTWGKMSETAHNIALSLTLPPHLAALVTKALS